MTTHPIPTTMKAPGDPRPFAYMGGIIQVKVTNVCDLDCKNCSVAVGIAKKLRKQFLMSPENYRLALRSLKGYPGVIGMFGGNPCIHPQFDELCQVLREEVPNREQRGLWSNRLMGKGSICRETFGPHNNLNVHQSQAAWDEFRRDWPEAELIPSGLSDPSLHGPIFGSPTDLGVSEEDMWKGIGSCSVNQEWSAEINQIDGKLYAYFCEIAATMAEIEDDPNYGEPLAPGWWKRGMPAWASQVRRYCTRCLIPLNSNKVDAASGAPEDYTVTWAKTMQKTQLMGRPLRLITNKTQLEQAKDLATDYLPYSTRNKCELCGGTDGKHVADKLGPCDNDIVLPMLHRRESMTHTCVRCQKICEQPDAIVCLECESKSLTAPPAPHKTVGMHLHKGLSFQDMIAKDYGGSEDDYYRVEFGNGQCPACSGKLDATGRVHVDAPACPAWPLG